MRPSSPSSSAPVVERASPLRHDLTTGPVGRTLLLFALPVLGSNVLQSLSISVNAMWVGHFLGEAALTATSNANILMFFLLGWAYGIGTAATILVGQAVGARDFDQAKRVVGAGAVFFLGTSVLMATIGFLQTPAILEAMHTPADARPYAIAYLRILFLATPVMIFFTFAMATLRGAGDVKTPLRFMILSVALDIVLNPVLIFGLGPLPKLGIAGAAAATFIAQSLSLAALFWRLYRRDHELCLRRGEWRYLKPDLAIWRVLVVKGLPMSLQLVVMSSSAIALMSMVNAYGSQTTAAYGVVTQVWNYVLMPAMALGAGISAMAAQNVGAQRWDRLGHIVRSGLGLNVVLTGIPTLLIFAFNRPVLGLFLPADGEAIVIAQHINALAIWAFVIFGVGMVIFGVVRATGAVMAPLLILFTSLWLFRIPFAKWMEPRFGSDAIWISFPLGAVVTAVLAVVYYRRGHWKQARMTG